MRTNPPQSTVEKSETELSESDDDTDRESSSMVHNNYLHMCSVLTYM